jgi:hypothetical protein
MPGDNISMDVELIAPIAMDEGLRFAIREAAAPSVPASSPPSSSKVFGRAGTVRRAVPGPSKSSRTV